MMPPDLRSIRTFKELTRYLEDELDWPLEEYGFDDLTFSYDPPELGLKAEDAVKVRTIHQLRPFKTGQPWGIFFVEFEKKRLPIVVLRRILRHLVLKKRASANAADAKRWQPRDLLFISAWGDEEKREMTFAHFVDHPELGLAELRVLGWDDDDTPLHMNYVADQLGKKLRWSDDFAADPEAWRSQWAGAFVLRHRHVIKTSEELAAALAELARNLRSRIRTILRMEDGYGEIRKLQRAFQTGLIHDLDDDGFADMFAQTVTYGLFSLACRRTVPGHGTAFVKDDLTTYFTSPFLKEMLGVFLGLKSRKGKIDFDELGVSDVTDLLTSEDTHMEVVLADFNNKTRGEDPVIHFYEHFLSAYNKQLKIQRGVFYTPQPAVSYIVRGVHELLQTEFGLEDGLASIVTWGEMVKRHPEMKIPLKAEESPEKGTIDADEPFVQILDVATGTATFIVEVIDVIHKTMVAKWKKAGKTPAQIHAAWNDYVPKHLLPRVYGFELMMAPYAIAHMKVGLKLSETGYLFATEVPVRIYLTNTLEPKVTQLPQIGFDALAHEAKAVNEVKWYKRFTVLVGNPPYSNFGQLNKNPFVSGLLEDYKRGLEEKKINIDDDFIKFTRFAHWTLEKTGVGCLGFITNNTYLDGITHRQMRQSLMNDFQTIRFVNLHGDSRKGETTPDGRPDENVFDIQQGVAIGLFVRSVDRDARSVRYLDIWGQRTQKYSRLAAGKLAAESWTVLNPTQPYFFAVPKDFTGNDEYETFVPLTEVLIEQNTGVQTKRDELFIAMDKHELASRFQDIAEHSREQAYLKRTYSLEDSSGWSVSKLAGLVFREQAIVRVLYRPFDIRWLYYDARALGRARESTMRHMILGKNVGLITLRINGAGKDFVCLATRYVIEKGSLPRGNYSLFPLFLFNHKSETGQLGLSGSDRTNFGDAFSRRLNSQFRRHDLTPEDIFHYAYAVFHSPGYRSRYAEFLKIDFPRLPLTGNLELFRALARLGGELTALHLLESPLLGRVGVPPAGEGVSPSRTPERGAAAHHARKAATQDASLGGQDAHPTRDITEFIGGRNPEIEKISWSHDTVWVDKAQTTGFRGVPEGVWNFHIGGYQVCAKWLKDRKGRTLTKDDLAHYQKIVIALAETIRLMAEIDAVIEQHGGWPGAFAASTTAPAATAGSSLPGQAELAIPKPQDDLPFA